MSTNKYKILSIDGGGIKGVFPAAFIASIEETTGERFADYFDLIVGTSTGGIITLGLGLDYSGKDILKFYEDMASSVFGKQDLAGRIKGKAKHLALSKYDSAPLKSALESVFADRKLGESTNRLVVPSLNLENGKVYIYKTAHHERLETDYKEKAVDVAMATSAAPSYFPTYEHDNGIPLIDGGVFANNPIGLAAVEAITVLGWPMGSFEILSIGCTSQPLDVKAARRIGLGQTYWSLKSVDVFMTAQESVSMGTASLIVGDKEKITRINPIVPGGRFTLDGIKEIPSLKGLGFAEAREALPGIRRKFMEKKAEPFKPHHSVEAIACS